MAECAPGITDPSVYTCKGYCSPVGQRSFGHNAHLSTVFLYLIHSLQCPVSFTTTSSYRIPQIILPYPSYSILWVSRRLKNKHHDFLQKSSYCIPVTVSPLSHHDILAYIRRQRSGGHGSNRRVDLASTLLKWEKDYGRSEGQMEYCRGNCHKQLPCRPTVASRH